VSAPLGRYDGIARVAGWFIPPAVASRGREAVIRSQALLVAVALGTATCLVSAWIDFRIGQTELGWATLLWMVGAAASPFVLRWTASLDLAGNLLVASLFLQISTLGALMGGNGPPVLSLFLVPAFAVLLCSRRAALTWTLLAAIAVLALGALAAVAHEPPPPDPSLRLHRIAFLALIVSSGCLLTYDLMKTAALRDLERANAALGESREQYRQLVETSPDAVFVTAADGTGIRYANSRAVELLGARSEAEVIGLRAEAVLERPEDMAELRREIAAGRRVSDMRLVVRTFGGERVPVETSAGPTRFEGEPAVLSVVRDRREEERTLARLRLLGTVVEQAHEGVLIIDAAGMVRYVNETYARARGLSADSLVGRSVTELPRDDAARSFLRKLPDALEASGGVLGGRFTFDGPEGRRSWDIRVFPVQTGDPRGPASVTLLRDVSREVELEENARQSQKMEAVGQLAGGIAHDFNNHLTVILGHAEELRAALPEGGARAEVEAIIEAAERSAALTQQLLAFARRQPVDVQVLDLGQVVRGMEEMLRRLLPERIALSVELGGDVPPVLADRGQAEQIVLNLVLNARDAIEGAGRIRVATEAGPLPEELRAPGGEGTRVYALLRVTDDGHGIEASVRSRVFEPFFTTKPPGRGTGLGLSTVHGIVHQAGGAIDLASAPGEGTAVAVYLPAADRAALPAAAEVAPEAREASPSGTVLVVEDDPGVRRLTRRALQSAGFRVLEAEGAEQALRLAAGAQLDLVVTDIVMPGRSGLELADRIAETHPDVPVLFVSGYAEDAAEHRHARVAGRELLAKPFRPQQLVERVRQLLDAQRGRR
jgi:PAS domain S-box-containing protein